MDPKEKLAALIKEAAELRIKAEGNDFTEADADRADAIAKEHGELTALIARKEAAAKSLAQFGSPTQDSTEDSPVAPARKGLTLGEQFTNSEAYAAFKKAYPLGAPKDTPVSIKAQGIGPRFTRKAAPLTSGVTGNARAVRTDEVDDLVYRPERRLLDLVTRGTTNLPWFQYRQIISKTNNAAIVAEATDAGDPTALANTTTGVVTFTPVAGAGLKPLSTLTTTTAEAKAYTYADGMEVTNQELSDDGIMQSLIDSTLTENLEIEIENILLNGTGVGEEPKGILATTGVLQQAFSTDVQTTIRKAITLLRTTSGTNIRGVLMNPTDDEAWDLIKDTTGRYLGNGPFGSGPSTAWGYERITSQSIAVGQAIVGDFSTIHLLQLELLSILAFNQHKDFAQRNLTYIRAEQRLTQLVRNAARLCVVDLTA